MVDPTESTARDTPTRDTPAPSVVLRILSSPDRDLPAELPLGSVPLAIGRAPSAERSLAIRDARLSRSHAVLWLEGGSARLRDASTNGTFVGGERVAHETTVHDGDVIRAGDTFFLLRGVPHGGTDAPIDELVGRAPSIAALRAGVALVAGASASVLVLGESGTGKELVARAIHARSERSGRFVPVNCGAIPEALAESQLFGHVAGAFTGARDAHVGLFRHAHEGTLFLDEIGEMPLAVQAKLLRAIEDRVVQPVGSDRPVAVDVRIVCATNRDLHAAARDGRFRGDLYARISDLTLTTPPLRERREDVLPIFVRALGDGAPEVAPDLIDALLRYDWPYNVRELIKVATEARLRGQGRARLDLELVAGRLVPTAPARSSFPPASSRPSGGPPAALASDDPSDPSSERGAPPTADEIRELWTKTGGNVSEIARTLGRSRRQVRRYLESVGVRTRE